LFVFTQQRI